MNNVFRLVNPVLDRDMYIYSRVLYSYNWIHMHRLQYSILRSAYSTCRVSRGQKTTMPVVL